MSMFRRLSNHASGEIEKAIFNLVIGGATIVVLSIIGRGVGAGNARY